MLDKTAEIEEVTDQTDVKKCPLPWWKRLGFIGFMFFLLKGLGWIALAVISYVWGPDALNGITDFFKSIF